MPKKRKKKPYRKRRWFTATELVEIWDRWQRGETTKEIGRALDRGGSTIHGQLAVCGGIRPRVRCRSTRMLTFAEREEISRGIAAQQSIRSIAESLSGAPSTVSREIGRNGGYDNYRALDADERAWERAHRPKRCRLIRYPQLRGLVEEKLGRIGHLDKLRVGSNAPTRKTHHFTCHTKRSIAAFSSRPAGL